MNYNANTGGRQTFGKKVKRVSDVNAMGYTPYKQGNADPQQNLYPNIETDVNNSSQQGFESNPYDSQAFSNKIPVYPELQLNNYQTPYVPMNRLPAGTSQLGVLNTPVVQDIAVQYGQQLAGAGKNLIKNEVERFVPVSKLKYYFAVDAKYVISKIMLLLFPFTHRDWAVKFEQHEPIQPRYEINAPDLYIPTMAYITYVLVGGIILGMREHFSSEQIGILASSALTWYIVELLLYCSTLYIIQVETSLQTLDLLAYCGYKYVGMIISILISLIFNKSGYYFGLVYMNLALAFFLVRSLKIQVLSESGQETSYYGAEIPTSGHRRRAYFLLFVAALQPALSWWLTYHLINSPDVTNAGNKSK